MPAANSIANHAVRLNSGFSPSLPRTIRPVPPIAAHAAKATKPLTMRM